MSTGGPVAWADLDRDKTNNIANIHVATRDLVKPQVFVNGAPVCVLFIFIKNQWQEFGRTEISWNNLNPSWIRLFRVAQLSGFEQRLRFVVYHGNFPWPDLNQYELVGSCETVVSQLSENETALELKHPEKESKRGTLVITMVNLANDRRRWLGFVLKVSNLKRVHTFAKDSPYFQIQRANPAAVLYRSATAAACYSTAWDVISSSLCDHDLAALITITFWDQNGKRDPISLGSITRTALELLNLGPRDISLQDGGRATMKFLWHDLSDEEPIPPDGIITRLTNRCGGNVFERGLVKVTVSSETKVNKAKDVVSLNDFQSFLSTDPSKKDGYVQYDFQEKLVEPKQYIIRSSSLQDGPYLKSWILEASIHGDSWLILDSRENVNSLCSASAKATFDIHKPKTVRIVRLRQTGANSNGDFALSISAFELVGDIVD